MAGGYAVTFTVVDAATKQIDTINKRIQQMRAPMERQARAMQQFMDVSGLSKIAAGFTSIARTAADAFSSMSRLVPVMGALTGAASLAGIANLVAQWQKFGNTLTQDATRIGTTTTQLQQLEDAITLAGGSAGDMDESLKGLTETIYKAALGDAESAAWFQKAGISLRDANGNLKNATDLLPEVIRYLDQIKDPAERMRVAAGLGSEALAKLEEQFRRSGRTLPQWLEEAKKYAPTLDDQGAALQRYNQAVGALEVAFGHLKTSIGGVLADALTPLLRQFGEWVRTHQPQIKQAVTDLADRFRDWIQGIDWDAVKQGADSIGGALKFLGTHLDKIIEVALVIKGLQIAGGIVSSVGAITTAIGTIGALTGGGLLAGTGLLGALGTVLWLSIEIYKHWDEIKQAGADLFAGLESGWSRVTKSMSDYWRGVPSGPAPEAPAGPPGPPRPQVGAINPFTGQPVAEPPAPGAAPPVAAPFAGGPPPVAAPFPGPAPFAFSGGPTSGATPQLPQAPPIAGRASGQQLANRAIDYFVGQGWTREQAAGIAANLAAESSWRPRDVGDQGAAFGLAQWHPDRQADFQRVMGKNIRDSSFDEQLAFVNWELNNTERGAGAQLRRTTTAAEAGAAVSRFYERPADAQGEQARRGASAMRILAAAPQAEGKPAQVTGGPPVSGSVDVTVTHRNPPPGTTIAAKAAGEGVNVAPPRTEQQQFSFA